jgi:hypothetical protein
MFLMMLLASSSGTCKAFWAWRKPAIVLLGQRRVLLLQGWIPCTQAPEEKGPPGVAGPLGHKFSPAPPALQFYSLSLSRIRISAHSVWEQMTAGNNSAHIRPNFSKKNSIETYKISL